MTALTRLVCPQLSSPESHRKLLGKQIMIRRDTTIKDVTRQHSKKQIMRKTGLPKKLSFVNRKKWQKNKLFISCLVGAGSRLQQVEINNCIVSATATVYDQVSGAKDPAYDTSCGNAAINVRRLRQLCLIAMGERRQVAIPGAASTRPQDYVFTYMYVHACMHIPWTVATEPVRD